MPVLVELDKHKDANKIHEGSIKLEEDVPWTDVVAARHHPLHHHGHTHSIEQAEVLRNSKPLSFMMVKHRNCLGILSLLQADQGYEENTETNIPNVAENMVECRELASRFETQKVVVTEVLISFCMIRPFRGDLLFQDY